MILIRMCIVKAYSFFLKIIIHICEPFLFINEKKNAKPINESLVIVCLAKNNASQLKKTLKRFSYIQQYFSDFKVLVYENNSEDDTKKVLDEAKNTYPFLEFFAFDYTQEELEAVATIKVLPSKKQCRIQHIAKGRNFLLEKVAHDYSNFSTVLAFDSDVYYFNPYYIVKKMHTFITQDFDVLSVNGLTKMFKYRDAYAFRSTSYPYGPEYLGNTWWKETVPAIQQRYKKNQFLPVYSAFGGAAFYKTKDYIKSGYSALHTKTSLNVQEEIITKNPSSKRNDAAPIHAPIANTNYNAPIVCEHIPLHYTLYIQGHSKQYIDTSWRILFL